MRERREYWQQLFYTLSEGRPEGVPPLKAMDIFDFYTRLDVWEKDLKAKIERIQKK